MTKRIKKCALCREEKEGTFEHIPPRMAFNAAPAKPVSGLTLLKNPDRVPWDTDGLPYMNQQKGMGLYSLCEKCNNTTGAWYGNDYCEFAKCIDFLIRNIRKADNQGVEIQKIYPLRIIKQVISMFCSINPDADSLNDLRKFVLDKTLVGIDKKRYKVCMYFTDSNIIRYWGLNAVLNLKTHSCSIQSEITAYPLGFILYLDPEENQEYKGLDITCFADSRYDDACNVKMPILRYEVNTWFPLDYRNKAEIWGNMTRERNT